jgi:hypothetical protein
MISKQNEGRRKVNLVTGFLSFDVRPVIPGPFMQGLAACIEQDGLEKTPRSTNPSGSRVKWGLRLAREA